MQIKPVTLAITILIPLAATSPLARRDAATVVDDLNTISTDLDAFDQAVKNFQGGLTEALNIQAKESDLENDIKATTADTQDSAAFSDSGSSQVTNTLLDLEPDILNSLDLIVSKVFLLPSNWVAKQADTGREADLTGLEIPSPTARSFWPCHYGSQEPQEGD